ncbi:MAG: DUF2860 domain-containing protein [Desulfobulbaceae bacterium]|nr:MAG: DUF2860 domain-containing protein [Desulfobulbaceae bacterium]
MSTLMKNMFLSATFVMVLTLVFCPTLLASQPTESTDTFSGRVGLGFMFINSGNNLNPNGSEKRITNLDDSADPKLNVIPFIAPSFTYDAGEPGNFKLFFNTRPAIDEVGSFSFNLGGTYPTDIGVVELSAIVAPFERVWENPYQLNTNRTTSPTSNYGTKLALNRIMNSGFHANIVVINRDVDDDIIGDIEPDLQREGQVYALNINYLKTFSRSFGIRPRFSIRKGEFEGESNSFTKVKLSLDGRYTHQKFTVLPQVSYAYKKNDKVHPIFNETKEENALELRLLMSYAEPFDLEDWAAQMLVSYSYGDVNIDFYDTEALTTGVFLVYNF